ncbi:MAG: PRC-barrel domain-containing protein [Desulfobacterales bacterium]|nr:PRC-barrel domain-containing protein [Desulfobacterales bacterium]
MKKLFLVLCVSAVVLSLATFASAQQRGYQGSQDQQQRQYGTQDQYGRQDRSQWQYGERDQQQRQYGTQDRQQRGRTDRQRQQMGQRFSSASDLIDKKVKNDQGQELGSVKDLIITRNGQVAYLIVAKGGVLGMGGDNIPIPFRNADLSQQQDSIILSNIDKQQLENAPTISENNFQMLEDPQFQREVFSYYGQQRGMGGYQQQREYPQQREYQRQQPDTRTYQQQQQQRPMKQERSGQTER